MENLKLFFVSFIICLVSFQAVSFADNWACLWDNGRTCKFWRNSTQTYCCEKYVSTGVTDKINLRIDWDAQNATVAEKSEQLANNFVNEVANLTVAANAAIADAQAMAESDNVSIQYRNSELIIMRDVWGANVTQEDLGA